MGLEQSNAATISASVVVPLFNKAEYVARAVKSVLAQTTTTFELIVVDDGSTDSGPEAVLALNDSRIRLVRQGNSGVSVARNRGAQTASAEIVAFLDADDEWDPGLLEELLCLAQEFPEACIYGVNQRIRMRSGRELCADLPELFGEGRRGLLEDYFDIYLRLGRSPFSSSSFAVRRSAFVDAGGYKPGVRLTEDSDLWFRMALRYPIAFSTRTLATYFMDTPGNTLELPPEGEFTAAESLRSALNEGRVRRDLRRSAASVVALLDLRLVRRALATARPEVARETLGRASFWRRYPLQALIYALMTRLPRWVPQTLVSGWRRVRHQ